MTNIDAGYLHSLAIRNVSGTTTIRAGEDSLGQIGNGGTDDAKSQSLKTLGTQSATCDPRPPHGRRGSPQHFQPAGGEP